jgi:uncharacterized DUF497 family protein
MASTFAMLEKSSMDRSWAVEDTRESYGEPRYVALGLLEDIVVSIAYTERGENIRVISIRKALKNEARFFFSQIGK